MLDKINFFLEIHSRVHLRVLVQPYVCTFDCPSVRPSIHVSVRSKSSPTVRPSVRPNTTKGGFRRLEKSHKVWMMMMIAASLMWAGAAEKPD